MITIREAAQTVKGLSEHTVRQLTAQDKIPSIRTGAGKNGKILVLSLISDVFSYGVKMGAVSDNPCSKVTIPKVEQTEKQIYSPEQVGEFFKLLYVPFRYKQKKRRVFHKTLRNGYIL